MLCNVARTRVDTLLNLRMMYIHVLGPEKGGIRHTRRTTGIHGPEERGTQKPEMESHRDEALHLSEE